MYRNPAMQEFQVETKPRKNTWTQKFVNNCYNENTGELFGRTPERWGKLLIFYAIFYAVLIALFAICMATFLQHYINPRVPRLQQEYSVIGTSPGLGFRPLPKDVRSTLIYYKGTGYDSYKYWEDQLIDFLSVYKKKGQTAGAGQNIFDCDFNKLPPPGKVCDVDVRSWEPCIQENHFSFHKSSPCIFLKLNRIYGWRPEFYNETDTLPTEMPHELQYHIKNISHSINRNYVWVSCYGETPADKENIGPVHYLPKPGFPGYFYPYQNAEGYLSPLVAVHLTRPKRIAKWSHIEMFYNLDQNNSNFVFAPALTEHHLKPNVKQQMRVKLAAQGLSHSVTGGLLAKIASTGIVINIECRAWARNIRYDRRERLGVVHFELMIE